LWFSTNYGILKGKFSNPCIVESSNNRVVRYKKGERIMARKVVEEKCMGCGACAGTCAFEAITVDGVAKIDAAKCQDCGACEGACPAEAITAA